MRASLPSGASRPIRVAHVIQNLHYGGMERVLHNLALQLSNRGFDIHVVVLGFFGRFAEGLDGAVTLHQAAPMSRLSLFHPRTLTTLLRNIAPDIVHSHGGVWLKAARAARQAGVPITIHTDHGRPDPIPLVDRVIDNIASRWTDAVLTVSEPLASLVRNQIAHKPSRVRVITNGVDTERIRPNPDRAGLRRELGLPERGLVIGSVGRLEPIKNFQLALRAFVRLEESMGDSSQLVLALVGDGSERPALESMALASGLAGRVNFLGWRNDAQRLYSAFDLFTLTSRSEGTSVSLLEAMSSAVCPVVTDVGGNGAVLGSDLASLLVPDNDEVALAEAWQRHLRDPGLRAKMGLLARDRAQTQFSIDSMVERHAGLYTELLEKSRLGSGRDSRAPLVSQA